MDSESNQDKLTEESSKKDYSVTFQMRLLAQEVSETQGCQQLEEYTKISHCPVLIPILFPFHRDKALDPWPDGAQLSGAQQNVCSSPARRFYEHFHKCLLLGLVKIYFASFTSESGLKKNQGWFAFLHNNSTTLGELLEKLSPANFT